jgi:ABC-2 type transport system permease protein
MNVLDNMRALVTNELIKIFTKISTILFCLLLTGILLGSIFLLPKKVTLSQWKTNIKKQVTQYKANSNSTENILSFMGATNYKYEKYALDKNIIYDSFPSLWSSLDVVIVLKYLISIFLIVIAANIMSNEFKDGTIKFLTIKPISRFEILLSKWLTLIVMYFGFIIFSIIIMFLLGSVKYGFSGFNTVTLYTGSDGLIHQRNLLSTQLLLIGGKTINDIMSLTIAFMVSTLIRSNSLSIIISICTLFSGLIMSFLGNKYTWINYTPFPHMDLTQYMPESHVLIKGNNILFSVYIIIIYFIIIQCITFFSFIKRDIT